MSETTPGEMEDVHASSESIELVIVGRPRDLGGFAVRRSLPSMQRRLVGPFIFLDHMGPTELAPGVGIDVRPHPHIGLATVTFLFDGAIVHRDSLGSHRTIRPGDVNWMLAGCGIVHSERSDAQDRRLGAHVHGMQSWVALPLEQEESAPSFEHHPASALPRLTRPGVTLEVIAGHAFGARAPVTVLSPTLYVHARLDAGATLVVEAEHAERAVYVVDGELACDGRTFAPGTLLVLRPGMDVPVDARSPARLMLIGGDRLAGERHIYWNFVSSSKERIERAKDDWQSDRFPKVPGDELERVPLPAR